MKPNLFIVGAPKCGTCAWLEYLNSHPDVFFAKVKEPHYFCTDFPNWRFFKTEEEYISLFKNSGHAKIAGEASVRYLYSKDAAKNIRKFNAEAKIIILVRDQKQYLPSQHNQLLFNGIECLEDFDQAWRLSESRPKSTIPPRCKEPRFLDYRASGRFYEQASRYFEEFPPEQVRVFHFEDWVARPRETYLEILSFLGLKDDGRTHFPKVNEAPQHRFPALAKVTQSPPRLLLAAVRFAKKVTGLRQIPLVAKLRVMNRTTGYRTRKPSPEVLQEIADYYRDDNEKMERLTWRAPAPVPADS